MNRSWKRVIWKGPDSFLYTRELPRVFLEKGRLAQERRSATCTSIDFRESYPTLRTSRKPRAKGWCFSHAAADMMSIYYQKNNLAPLTVFSAVGVAIDYYYNDPHVSQWHQSREKQFPQRALKEHYL